MSSFIRSQCRLFKHFSGCSQYRIIQQNHKYSQQNYVEPVVSRKKKYLFTGFIGMSFIAFGYYLHKEKEYGNYYKVIFKFNFNFTNNNN